MTFASGTRLTASGMNAVTVQACTSGTHPTSLAAGEPIFETDTGLAAFSNGGVWMYVLGDVAAPVVLLATTASVSFTISSNIRHVTVKWQARTTSGNLSDFVELRLNSDSGNNYGWQYNEGQGSTAQAAAAAVATASFINVGRAAGGTSPAGYYGAGSFDIPGWGGAGSGHQASIVGTGFVAAGTGATQMIAGTYTGAYIPSAALTTITLLPVAGSFAAGSSFSVLGCN